MICLKWIGDRVPGKEISILDVWGEYIHEAMSRGINEHQKEINGGLCLRNSFT